MSDTTQRPIDRILARAVEKGFRHADGAVNIRGLAKAASLSNSQLIRSRDGKNGRLDQPAYEALAAALETTVSYFIGEAPAVAPAAAPVGDIILAPYSRLVRWERNHRKTFTEESVAELAESIAEKGLLENLVARPMADKLQIGAGERRWRAIGLLVNAGRWNPDEPNIPVKVVDEPDDDEFLATGLAENEQREDVNPIEAAEGYAEMIAMNPEKWRPSTIAKRLGKSARHVQQRLALVTKLAPEVQQAVRAGLVTFTQARELTMATPDKQVELVNKIDQFKTADQLRDQITAGMVPATRAIFDVEGYTGAIVTSEQTGACYFARKDEFLAAQRAAAGALADNLAADWAWTELVEGYSAPIYLYERGTLTETRGTPNRVDYLFSEENRPRAGVLVHFEHDFGRVTVHAGLLRPVEAEPDPEEEARQRAEIEAQQQETAARRQALSDFIGRMRDALVADPMGALRLLVIYPALTYHNQAPIDPTKVAGVSAAGVQGGKYGFLARFVTPANEAGVHVLRADVDLVAVWKAALTISDQQAVEAVAGFVSASITYSLHQPLHPLVAAIATHYGVDIPEPFRPAVDEADEQTDIEDTLDAEKMEKVRAEARINDALAPGAASWGDTLTPSASDVRTLLAGAVNRLNGVTPTRTVPGGLMLGPDTMGGATAEQVIDGIFGIYAESTEYADIQTMDDAVAFVCRYCGIFDGE